MYQNIQTKCDRISDMVVDTYLGADPYSFACEMLIMN